MKQTKFNYNQFMECCEKCDVVGARDFFLENKVSIESKFFDNELFCDYVIRGDDESKFFEIADLLLEINVELYDMDTLNKCLEIIGYDCCSNSFSYMLDKFSPKLEGAYGLLLSLAAENLNLDFLNIVCDYAIFDFSDIGFFCYSIENKRNDIVQWLLDKCKEYCPRSISKMCVYASNYICKKFKSSDDVKAITEITYWLVEIGTNNFTTSGPKLDGYKHYDIFQSTILSGDATPVTIIYESIEDTPVGEYTMSDSLDSDWETLSSSDDDDLDIATHDDNVEKSKSSGYFSYVYNKLSWY